MDLLSFVSRTHICSQSSLELWLQRRHYDFLPQQLELVTQLNARVTRHLGASRRALFDEIERLALKKLPVEPYVYAEWKECKVGLDYHVEV